jgi:hypothetical protein
MKVARTRAALAAPPVLVGWLLLWGCDAGPAPATLHDGSGAGTSGAPGSSATGSTPGPAGSSSAEGGPAAPDDAGLLDADRRDAREASSPPPPPPTLPPTDPCAGVTCPDGQACVSEAHGEPLGVCVDTCDCSNCGNCAYDNADGRWDDMQEYCGNLKQSPATVVCNKPCAGAGSGCIYYGAVNICWPLEGCFSK